MTARKRAYGTAKEPVRHATVSTVGTQHVFSCAIYTSFWSYGFYFPILFCQIILPSETYEYSFQTDARSLRHISTRHLKTHGMRHQAFMHVTAQFLPYSANHKHTAQARLQTNARRPACAIHAKAICQSGMVIQSGIRTSSGNRAAHIRGAHVGATLTVHTRRHDASGIPCPLTAGEKTFQSDMLQCVGRPEYAHR